MSNSYQAEVTLHECESFVCCKCGAVNVVPLEWKFRGPECASEGQARKYGLKKAKKQEAIIADQINYSVRPEDLTEMTAWIGKGVCENCGEVQPWGKTNKDNFMENDDGLIIISMCAATIGAGAIGFCANLIVLVSFACCIWAAVLQKKILSRPKLNYYWLFIPVLLTIMGCVLCGEGESKYASLPLLLVGCIFTAVSVLINIKVGINLDKFQQKVSAEIDELSCQNKETCLPLVSPSEHVRCDDSDPRVESVRKWKVEESVVIHRYRTRD